MATTFDPPGAGASVTAPRPLLDDPPLWRMFLDPRGRIGRRSFWLFGVGTLLVAGALGQALLGIARVPQDAAERWINLLLLWPVLATSAKRWHDRDKSHWWVLIVLIPVIGWIWALIENGLLRGTPGSNRYGPAPDQHHR
jgi:uncharacterized membrane protein YhaH (DUF805 family)